MTTLIIVDIQTTLVVVKLRVRPGLNGIRTHRYDLLYRCSATLHRFSGFDFTTA